MNRRHLLMSTVAFVGCAITRTALAVMAGSIEIRDAWARASGTALETTAYLTLINHGTEPDWLVSVSSRRAMRVELRKMTWKGLVAHEGVVQRLAVPPMARTVIAPGGVEIHVSALDQAIHNGEELPLTLTFARAGPVDIAAKVTRRYLGPE